MTITSPDPAAAAAASAFCTWAPGTLRTLGMFAPLLSPKEAPCFVLVGAVFRSCSERADSKGLGGGVPLIKHVHIGALTNYPESSAS